MTPTPMTSKPLPTMRHKPIPIDQRGMLKPAEIAKLSRVLHEACSRRQASPDSEEAKELALTLLALHNAGMVGEADLMETVAFRRLDSDAGE